MGNVYFNPGEEGDLYNCGMRGTIIQSALQARHVLRNFLRNA
jgi:hypothetical protein